LLDYTGLSDQLNSGSDQYDHDTSFFPHTFFPIQFCGWLVFSLLLVCSNLEEEAIKQEARMPVSRRYTVNMAFGEETQKTWSEMNAMQQVSKNAISSRSQTDEDVFTILLQTRKALEEEADQRATMCRDQQEEGITPAGDDNTRSFLESQFCKMARRLSLSSIKDASSSSSNRSTCTISSCRTLLFSSRQEGSLIPSQENEFTFFD
jgi:Lhr-like helicase